MATFRAFYLDVSNWYFILEEMAHAYSIKYFLVKNSKNTHPPIMILIPYNLSPDRNGPLVKTYAIFINRKSCINSKENFLKFDYLCLKE